MANHQWADKDPVDYLKTILSDRSFARDGAAKCLEVDFQDVTEGQVQGFLDGLSAGEPLILDDYAEALRWAWDKTIDSAAELMIQRSQTTSNCQEFTLKTFSNGHDCGTPARGIANK